MWLLLTRRARIWLIFTVGVPVLAWLLSRVGRALEARNGPGRFNRLLQSAGNRLDRKRRRAEAKASKNR